MVFNGGERRTDLRAAAEEVAAGFGNSLDVGNGPPRLGLREGRSRTFAEGKNGKDRRLESRNSVVHKLGLWAKGT